MKSTVDIRHLVLYILLMVKRLTAVRFKEEHLAQLAEEAKRQDVPVSHLIRVAVSEFLQKLKESAKKKK
jgi:hypothetical protein